MNGTLSHAQPFPSKLMRYLCLYKVFIVARLFGWWILLSGYRRYKNSWVHGAKEAKPESMWCGNSSDFKAKLARGCLQRFLSKSFNIHLCSPLCSNLPSCAHTEFGWVRFLPPVVAPLKKALGIYSSHGVGSAFKYRSTSLISGNMPSTCSPNCFFENFVLMSSLKSYKVLRSSGSTLSCSSY